ncbi:MAG TPA: hypothetical protein VF518_08310 [Polyangia bacterium]
MTRFSSLILGTTLATGLLACGSNATSSKDPVSLVPVDDGVLGWTVDTSINTNGQPMTATSEAKAIALIDGAAAPFYRDPFTAKEFVWQNYVNTSLPAAPPPKGAGLVVYIWEMASADLAGKLYTALLQESEYSGNWQQPTSPPMGTESRIEDTNTTWLVNFHQDVFYVEVYLSPSYGPAPDYTIGNTDLKAEALRFAQAIASKI